MVLNHINAFAYDIVFLHLHTGTDCQDCGPVGADNFTRSDDDGWWDDDDDYWTFNDGNFLGKLLLFDFRSNPSFCLIISQFPLHRPN